MTMFLTILYQLIVARVRPRSCPTLSAWDNLCKILYFIVAILNDLYNDTSTNLVKNSQTNLINKKEQSYVTFYQTLVVPNIPTKLNISREVWISDDRDAHHTTIIGSDINLGKLLGQIM